MSTIPIFWTRLIIFVGGQHETPLSRVSPSIDLHTFLVALSRPNLNALRIRNMPFSWGHYPGGRMLYVEYSWEFSVVYFEEPGPGVIEEFLSTIDSPGLQHVHITRCPLPSYEWPMPAEELLIEDISDPSGLVALINDWNGVALTLIKCSAGVVDTALDVIATNSDPSDPGSFYVPCVRNLRLRDCKDFAFEKLRELPVFSAQDMQ
ncbi:hypothetical protein H0H81_003553 [Sphagnurus paluster]|uniref:Uncharacterized protein n=1 Tax=Sphagnurus paluster TaxID=117069 RepID=A0A9P7FWP8_9AGAR|nr:hypothetical protein H0H81_003553 [Sphagnurus paluster]